MSQLKLGNGLTVLVQEDHRIPEVGVAVAYGVGSRDDPPGYEGLAHVTEHALCGPSAHLPAGTLRHLEAVGAEANARTGPDDTVYLSELPARALETALWVESDRMGYALSALTARDFDLLKPIVVRERKQRGTEHAVERALADALYPKGHPYAAPTARKSHLTAVDLDAVRWFVQRHYAPQNAALAIVGDVDTRTALESAKKYFATLRASSAFRSARSSPLVPRLPETREITVSPPRGRNFRFEELLVAWITPPYLTADDAALDVAASLLRQRLAERLVGAESAFRTNVRQQSDALGSTFVVKASMDPSQKPEVALQVLDSELRALQSPSPAFERTRRAWVTELLERGDSLTARASALATSALRGPAVSTEQNLERYRALDAHAVARAVSKYLAGRPRVVVRTEFSRFVPPPRSVRR